MEYIPAPSIDPSKQGSSVENGIAVNYPFGEKIEPHDKSRKKILKKLPKKLKNDLMVVVKESLGDSTCNATSSTRSSVKRARYEASTAHSTENDLIYKKIKLARMEYEIWESYVERNFDEEDALTIHSLLSNIENQANGFDRYNDRELFRSDVMSKNGALYEEAKKGWALLEESKLLRRQYPEITKAVREQESANCQAVGDLLNL